MLIPLHLDTRTVPELVRVHFERFVERDENRRREASWNRKRLWDEDYGDLVRKYIRGVYSDPEVRKRMYAHVSCTCNPAKDITQAVACVYKRGVHRLLADATPDEEREWSTLLAEGDIALQAPSWNRFSFLLGPVLVAPVVVGGRLQREMILPYQAQVALDRAGQVEAAMWAVPGYYSTERDPRRWRDVQYVLVDREAWHYLGSDGRPRVGPDGQESVPHGVRDETGEPTCPVAVFRLDTPTLPDWWSSSANERLLTGTIEASFLWSRLDMVRARQDHRFLFASERTKGSFPEGQIAGGDPEASIVATSTGAGTSSLEAIDYATDPGGHIAHLRLKVGQLALPYGIPPDAIAYNFAGGETKALSIRLSSEQQAALRNEQVPPTRVSERRLAVLTAAVTRASKHWFSGRCPSPSEVAERFVFEVGELNRTEDPRARREDEEWRLKHGLRTVVDLARTEWDLPAAAAERKLRQNLDTNAASGVATAIKLPSETQDLGSDKPGATPSIAPDMQAGQGDVQRTALNGMQFTALIGALEKLSTGRVPPRAMELAIKNSFPAFPPGDVTEMVKAAADHVPPPQPQQDPHARSSDDPSSRNAGGDHPGDAGSPNPDDPDHAAGSQPAAPQR